MKELICIVCPRGCHLSVGNPPDCPVSGNACPRGAAYGRTEVLDPKRSVTATCPARRPAAPGAPAGSGFPGLNHDGPRRVPVRTTAAIPRSLVMELVAELACLPVNLPVRAGTLVVENWRDTGASVVVTRDLD